jgi:hypothetical protein
LEHFSKLSNTRYTSVIQVSDTDLRNIEAKKKTIFLEYLYDSSDTCHTSIIQVLNTDPYPTLAHIRHCNTLNYKCVHAS